MRSWTERCGALLVVGALGGACEGNSTNPDMTSESSDGMAEETGDDGDPAVPEGTDLTYENFGDGFLRNWCRGCHSTELQGEARSGAPAGVDFNTLDLVRASLERIEARATGEEPTMPPAGGPSAEERALLQAWLAAGAP